MLSSGLRHCTLFLRIFGERNNTFLFLSLYCTTSIKLIVCNYTHQNIILAHYLQHLVVFTSTQLSIPSKMKQQHSRYHLEDRSALPNLLTFWDSQCVPVSNICKPTGIQVDGKCTNFISNFEIMLTPNSLLRNIVQFRFRLTNQRRVRVARQPDKNVIQSTPFRIEQEALQQRDRPTLRVMEYFAKSLKIT